MKVLHIPNYYSPHIGGIEQTAQDIVNDLKTIPDIKQEVLCFNGENKRNSIDFVDDVKIIRAGCFTKIASQSLSFSLNKLLKKEIKAFQPDLIHFHFPNPFEAHFLIKELKKNSKIKLVVHYHLDITKQKIIGMLFKGQTEWLLNRAIKIIVTSPNYISGSSFLTKHKNKCVIIPSMVNGQRLVCDEHDKQKTQAIKNNYKNKTICLFVGRHVIQKGLAFLIDSVKYVKNKNVVFLIGGSGPLTQELLNKAKHYDNIIFLGRLTDSRYREYLYACDIFTFPSINKSEAFGLSLAEALYIGKPAVTFTIPGSGVNYVNLDKVTGLEAKLEDSEDYASKIDVLIDDKEQYLKFSKSAKERSVSLFSEATFNSSINTLYKEALK